MDIRSLGLALWVLAGPAAAADEDPPIRRPRFALALEPGLNSLASIGGFTVSVHPSPHFAVDAGAGFGVSNLRYGLRGRLFFGPWGWGYVHPFVGLSYSHARGWGNDTMSMDVDVTRNGETRRYEFGMLILPTDFLGGLFGLELRYGHALLRPGLGWTQALGGRRWRVAEGEGPRGGDGFPLDLLYGSGPSAFLAAGIYF